RSPLHYGLSGSRHPGNRHAQRTLPKTAVIERWPAALRLDQAAEYCGLSIETFKAVCPLKPIKFTGSSRGNRYLRVRLDEWLLSLDPNKDSNPTVRRFGERLGGQGEAGRT